MNSILLRVSDLLAQLLLLLLPRHISQRVRANISPYPSLLLLRTNSILHAKDTPSPLPRMTLFEGVFATLLFDMALFGTSNPIINGLISLFTSLQNSWDRPFASPDDAQTQVQQFCHRLDIGTSPWIWDKSPSEYVSLNDFFSRTYAPAFFPPLGRARLVSPACCTLKSYESHATLQTMLIKGCHYQLERVGLFPKEDVERYRENRVFVGYLSPRDYHRVHAPIAGKCIHCQMEGGDRRSASVKFFDGKFNILNDNRRLVIVLEEEEESQIHVTNGGNTSNSHTSREREDGRIKFPLRVAVVIVGGVGVDTITMKEKTLLGRRIEKGQELSAFRAGGSAFALFSTQPLNVVEPIRKAEESDMYVETLVGESLAQ